MPRSGSRGRKGSPEPLPASSPLCSPLTPRLTESTVSGGKKSGPARFRHAVNHLPWKRSSDKKKLADSKGDATGDATTSTCNSASFHLTKSVSGSYGGAGGQGGAVGSKTPADPGPTKVADKVGPPHGNLGSILREYSNWQRNGEKDVALLQAKIDDMWLDEVMLGCDTELFSRVRQAAADVEASRIDPEAAVRIASAAAAETEKVGLESIRTRLAARDCVRMAGGAEGLEQRVRRRRAEAIQEVNPHIKLLAEPGRASEVREVMDHMMRMAQDEFDSVNAMKTAKSEVVVELQDKSAQRDWLGRQLSLAVGLLEATSLFLPGISPLDAEAFFVDAIQDTASEEPIRPRAVKCLEVLQQWGTAAARALAILNSTKAEEGEDTDSTAMAAQPQHVPQQHLLQLQPEPQQSAPAHARQCEDKATAPHAEQPSEEQPRPRRPRSSSPFSPVKPPAARRDPVTPLAQSPPRQPILPPMSPQGDPVNEHELRGQPCLLEFAEQSSQRLDEGEVLGEAAFVDGALRKAVPSHFAADPAGEATNEVDLIFSEATPVPGG